MEKSIEKIKDELHDKGYKFTRQRKLIYEAMLNNHEEHLSCDDIHEIVRKNSEDMGIATIYRTLQLFEKLGIVYKVDFDDGFSRYELITGPEGQNHHHLICINCNKVKEVKLDLLKTLEEEIEKSANFDIVDHNVKFYGYCSECKK